MLFRGDIYYVDFGDKTSTHKQSGIRPAVIVSNNRGNKSGPIATVVPLTTKIHKKTTQPTHVLIPKCVSTGLSKNSVALAEQVDTIDKCELREKIGRIEDDLIMEQITIALQIQIGAYEEYNL